MTHAWYPTFDATKLTELVQYIRGVGNIEIVGIDEAISKVGNKVEIGNFHKPVADLPNPYFVTDAIGNTYTNGYKTADLTLRTKKVISETGPVVTTSDIEYVVSEKFDITGQTSVIVSGWASDGYGLYVFYDDAGNRKKVAYSTKTWNEGGDLLKDVEIQVPEGATKIAIAGYFRQQMPCLKVTDTLNLGDLATKDIISKADLATDVQASLGKADSALQSYTETDPTVPAWAKATTKPTYTASEVGALPDTTVIPSIDGLATETYVNTKDNEISIDAELYTNKQLDTHNTSILSHQDIREQIDQLTSVVASKEQLKPEFASSIEDCTDTTKLYVLPDGYIYAYMLTETRVEVGEANYTNILPLAVNADGTEYIGNNGEDGYKTETRLNSSKNEVAQKGMCCTGFMPITPGTTGTLRLKNITVIGTMGDYLYAFGSDRSTGLGTHSSFS
jgi:hypothetical protein